jgi:hypothetical protein
MLAEALARLHTEQATRKYLDALGLSTPDKSSGD